MKSDRDDECAPQWREKKQLVQRYLTISHLDRHKIVAISSRQRKSLSTVTLDIRFCSSFLSRGTSLPSLNASGERSDAQRIAEFYANASPRL